MDATRKRRPNWERRTQQEMVRLHSAADSEYFVCDIEYTFKYWNEKRRTGRIDMVAAHRPLSARAGAAAQLALIELKYGANAIDGGAGLQKHVRDLHGLVSLGDLRDRAEEMAFIVEQKRWLGILDAQVPVFDLGVVALHHRGSSQACVPTSARRTTWVRRPRLRWPAGVDARVLVLGEDLLLAHDGMLACDDISEDDMPAKIYSGRKLKDRTPRALRQSTD